MNKRDNIDSRVDRVLEASVSSSPGVTKRQKMKKSTNQIKRIAGVGILILVCGILTTGALMNFLVRQESDITVGSMVFWDTVPAENLVTSEDFSAIGGGTYEFGHLLSYSSDSTSGDVNVTFTWDPVITGITPSILINDVEYTSYILSPGDNIEVNTSYVLHPYITNGIYSLNLTLDLDGI